MQFWTSIYCKKRYNRIHCTIQSHSHVSETAKVKKALYRNWQSHLCILLLLPRLCAPNSFSQVGQSKSYFHNVYQ